MISVILSTFNRSETLRIAIKSVLRQKFKDFELIVVGDCCTDNSEEVVKSFKDERIQWHNLPVNSGNQYGPNNFGNQIAKGKYIAYQSHDDIWKSNHLESLFSEIEKTNVDIVHSVAVIFSKHKNFLLGDYKGKYDGKICLCPNIVLHKKEVWKDVGGWNDPKTISMPVDQDYFVRIFNTNKVFSKTNTLTTFKFPASIHGLYKRKENYSNIQESYYDKIEDDNFLKNLNTEPWVLTNSVWENMPVGKFYTTSRKGKGL